jgi:hypothetical protein
MKCKHCNKKHLEYNNYLLLDLLVKGFLCFMITFVYFKFENPISYAGGWFLALIVILLLIRWCYQPLKIILERN